MKTDWKKQLRKILSGPSGEDDKIYMEKISLLFLQERKKVIEEINKMKKENPEMKLRVKSGIADWLNDGYQLALSDVISVLTNERKEEE